MDRERAQGNIGAGLLFGAIALAILALTFFTAVIYIG
jgi:hypothetical protein